MESPSDRAGNDVDWEGRYLSHDTPWDKGEAHPGLRWWLSQYSLKGHIIVPGCGTGHDVRLLASDQDGHLLGVDIAPTAIKLAQKHPVTQREQYIQEDFLSPPKSWVNAFDGLFEHTCFCAIHPSHRKEYAGAAAAVIKPGGSLLAIFFLTPEANDGPPYGCTRKELDALFNPFFDLIQDEADFPTFAGREKRETIRLYRRKHSIS